MRQVRLDGSQKQIAGITGISRIKIPVIHEIPAIYFSSDSVERVLGRVSLRCFAKLRVIGGTQIALIELIKSKSV